MKKLVLLPLLALSASCATSPASEARSAAQAAQGQAELEKLLAGRTPGPVESCISSRGLRGNKSYGEGILVFEGATNGVVYVNRPRGGCPEVKSDRAIRTRQAVDRLCRGDMATVYDPQTGMEFGSCSLGDFQAYRK